MRVISTSFDIGILKRSSIEPQFHCTSSGQPLQQLRAAFHLLLRVVRDPAPRRVPARGGDQRQGGLRPHRDIDRRIDREQRRRGCSRRRREPGKHSPKLYYCMGVPCAWYATSV